MFLGKFINAFDLNSQGNNGTCNGSNISRGLGVILSMEPMLRDRYIDLVNARLAQAATYPVPKPLACSELKMSFMKDESDLADYFDNCDHFDHVDISELAKNADITVNAARRVICLALTPGGDGAFGDGEASYVTVSSEDDLVVLAVRTRGAVKAVKAIKAKKEAAPDVDEVKVSGKIIQLPGISWKEIIETIHDVHWLKGEGENSLLGHYLYYLGSCLPKWPRSPASEGVVVPVDFEHGCVRDLSEFCVFSEICELCVLYDFCKLRKFNISA
ncbi:MAG: hypothetical protein FWG71_10755 [Synergistaceae bacterium]|nr:hypothetical protein [Synergistaceae bacterium]